MRKVIILLFGLFALLCGPAFGATHYVAPLGAKVAGTPDGSEGKPFLSLETAFKSGKVKGGDTLLLKDGNYGEVKIQANAAFDKPVTIMSKNGKAAHFDRILIGQDTRNLILKNLSVWPSNPATGAAYLVRSYATNSDITVDGLDIRGDKDAANFMSWSAAKWERQYFGIVLKGPRSLAIRNKVTGVYDGISVGADSQIIDNVVNGFNGDGLRGVSRTTVRGNRVYNCIKVGDNHDDGFQSFASNGGSITDLVIDSNVIIEWTGAPNHPLRGRLQGIGLFGGPYVNLKVVNNLVAVSHSHGISVYGAKGAKILNNTVVNIRGVSELRPYIAVRNLKDGTPSTDVLVANNVAMHFSGKTNPATRVEFRDNSVISAPNLAFANPATLDYRPKAASGYIDSADPKVAPVKDLLGKPRPSGKAPDRGAYEVQAGAAAAGSPVPPPTAGPDETVSGAAAPETVQPSSPTGTPTPTGSTIVETTSDGDRATITTSPGGAKRIMLDRRKRSN